MSEERYTIGKFSELTGISKDTLRFYDKIGVLQPKMIGETSKYRYYTFDQFWYADMVVCLQRLGVPLQQITEVFEGRQDKDIISLLESQKTNALRMSEYFMRVADDIEWFARQQRVLDELMNGEYDEVRLEYFSQREVMYYENPGDEEDYFSLRPENKEDCHTELKTTDAIKRVRGLVLDPESLRQNELLVKGSYIDIGMSTFEHVSDANVMTLPDGEYACMVAEVIDGLIDLEPLKEWLNQNNRFAELIIADDLGLQFFSGKPDAYLCEVKALIKVRL